MEITYDIAHAKTAFKEQACSFRLWYSDSCNRNTVPGELVPYMTEMAFLSTKQVPSACLLKHSGSQSVTANRDVLVEAGFPLERAMRGERGYTPYANQRSTVAVLPEDSVSNTGGDSAFSGEPVVEEFQPEPSATTEGAGPYRYRIQYTDPWKHFAAMELCRRLGYELPGVRVWSGDGYRLQDPIPPGLLGNRWTGSKKNKVRFADIVDHDIKMYVILFHTHWGNYLRVATQPGSKHPHRLFCKHLRNKISEFLKGHYHPSWSQEKVESVFGPGYKTRSQKQRAMRLIETLKTVDGVFVQRYLATPSEAWTWEKFDMFTLWNLYHLIDDEFLDGELVIDPTTIETAYSELKQARKLFKSASHSGRTELKTFCGKASQVAKWLRHFIPVWKDAARYTGHQYVMRIGILCQTRGAGTPPPVVVLASKVKFLRGIQEAPEPLGDVQKQLLRLAMDKVISTMPPQAFTGLSTKARVTVTTTASYESTRREGGTLEAIRKIVHQGSYGVPVEIRDLETGEVTGLEVLSNLTPGEYIFWKSLEFILRCTAEERRTAFLTVVKEPGKARSVTKTLACVKVVLDLVNKLCSEPMLKGIPSSESGMGRAHHGWNLFTAYMGEDKSFDMFAVKQRVSVDIVGGVERTDFYEKVFALSTDYEEATDHMSHEVGRMLGVWWMRACGIPTYLRKLVADICYKPRTIVFEGKGFLKKIGVPTGEGQLRRVTLRKGVLMGDPLTKPVLHLTNVTTRVLAEHSVDPSFLRKGFTSANELAELFSRIHEEIK
jgi:hypothetical protein